MLAVARTWLPLSEKGWDMAAASRSGSPSRPSAPSIRMANSSPPSRATVSALRAQARNRSATAMSSRSPSPWPRLSFTVLKSSRSRKRTVTGVPRRWASASAWLTRSRNRARLASPVSGSWNAWWVSCSSSRRRSLTSRVLSTTPFTVGVVQQVGREDLGVQPGAVGLAEAPLDRAGDARRLRRGAKERGRPLPVIGMEQLGHGAAHHRRRIVAEHPGGRRAHEPDRAVRPGDDDDVGRVLHQRAETGLVLARRVLGEEPHVLPHGEELAQHHQRRSPAGPRRRAR